MNQDSYELPRIPLALLMFLCTALMIAALFPIQVQAAESVVINSLSVTFKDNYGEEDEILEPDISVNVKGAHLSEVIWERDLDKWRPGRKVRATLVLASDGMIFTNNYNRSDCKVSGAQYVSAKAEDNETLVVKVDYLPVVVLGVPGKAGWSRGEKTRAVWDKVEYATGYQLNLYADDKRKAKLSVDTNSADLSSYINDDNATWYYEVRAVGYTAEDRKYRKEGRYITSEDTYFDDLGDVSGTWKNGQYRTEEGEYAVNSWMLVRGKWYYFDENGKRKTGWLNTDGKWYYLDSEGVMSTGWLNLDGKWYFLKSDGAMAVGWNEIAPDVWYFFHMDGQMAYSTWVGPYQIDENGIWVNR